MMWTQQALRDAHERRRRRDLARQRRELEAAEAISRLSLEERWRMALLRRQHEEERRARRRERATWAACIILAVAIVALGMTGGLEGMLGAYR